MREGVVSMATRMGVPPEVQAAAVRILWALEEGERALNAYIDAVDGPDVPLGPAWMEQLRKESRRLVKTVGSLYGVVEGVLLAGRED
jgi:hypothetical protein